MSIEEEFDEWLLTRTEYGAPLALAAWKTAYAKGRSDAESEDARMREAAILKALVDCVMVMERDLAGLPVIQPELRQARIALAKTRGEE